MAEVLETNGFTVTTLVEPTIAASSPAIVGVFEVTTASGDDVPAADLDPLLQQLRDREPPLCPMLFASDRQARAIRWDHDGRRMRGNRRPADSMACLPEAQQHELRTVATWPHRLADRRRANDVACPAERRGAARRVDRLPDVR